MHRYFLLGLLSIFSFLTGVAQTTNPLIQSFDQHQALKAETNIHLQAVALGPVVNGARAEAVQVDHQNPGTMYVAFGSGNLWKTVDNGLSWNSIFNDMPSHGIGDIAIAPSDPNILYVGTGESLRKRRNFTLPGCGIYRSNDAGKNWVHLGLENSWHIGEIAVHPTNPDIVFVAVLGKFWSPSKEKGIYKTSNGGKTWKKVLYVNENVRANDIVIATSDPNVIYASLWENNTNDDLKESIYGPGSSVYKSSDGGDSWNKISNGLPTGIKTGRIGVAVSSQNPDKAYALIDNINKKRETASEIYKTTNGGISWSRTHTKDLKFSSTIGWYFSDIYISPEDDDEVYALGVQLIHSTDGAKTFSPISGDVKHLQPSAAQTLHLDQCELWINPTNPSNLYLCNDGGLYTSYDKGLNWLHHNNIPSGEFYDITVTQGDDYTIYGGTQDDATAYGPPKEYNPKVIDPWKYLWIDAWSGGDGCVTQVNPDNPNTIYFSMQNGAIRKMDFKEDSSVSIKPKLSLGSEEELQYNFITPYFISPYNSTTLYHGGNFIFKTTNEGEEWKLISRDLSKSSYPNKQSVSAGALTESPIQPGLLYMGTDHGAFWYSLDDGKAWQEASESIADGYIRSISASAHDINTVYMSMTGLNYDDLNCYIYQSRNNGKDWTSIKSNLPNEPANVILEDPLHDNIIYAGLHRGLYCSFDQGKNWLRLASEMPNVPVADLDINIANKQLVIATHGRGIYLLDLNPIYVVSESGYIENPNKDITQLFDIKPVDSPKARNTHKDVDINSLEKLEIYYWSNKERAVDLELSNKDLKVIWSEKLIAKEGLNHYRWDLTLSTTTSDEPYFIHHKKYISAGRYKMKLRTDKNTFIKSVLIKK